MNIIKLLLVLILASIEGCGSKSSSSSGSSSPSFSGTYAGTVNGSENSVDFTQDIEFVLTQVNSSSVIGTWISGSGGSGGLTATITQGTALTNLQISETDPGCPGTYIGSAILQDGTLTGTYNGKSSICGEISATFIAKKQ